jgi:hypothetical protein
MHQGVAQPPINKKFCLPCGLKRLNYGTHRIDYAQDGRKHYGSHDFELVEKAWR